ncbi:inositol monophosphatase [Saccharothrix sp. HUAS TT1]|uniref:inositol monophosphatase family protein n=1 Tax=unclassified Saccharothrix TaxID=2593673 RepID=UPI00345BD22E
MKRSRNELAEIAQQAVDIGHQILKSTRPNTVTSKSDRDVYTDVDVHIERRIRAHLSQITPEFGFLGEEEGGADLQASEMPTWVLDPIDGTSNFAHGIPLYAVQIALVEQGKALVAAVDLPVTNSRYVAVKGGGAYVNGRRIRVSNTQKLEKSVVSIGDYATGEGSKRKNDLRIALTALLAQKVERIRMFGSAAHDLVWAAEGRTEAAVMLSNNTVDTVAGTLIAVEAGALALDGQGQPHNIDSKETVVLTPFLAEHLMPSIRSLLKGSGKI